MDNSSWMKNRPKFPLNEEIATVFLFLEIFVQRKSVLDGFPVSNMNSANALDRVPQVLPESGCY